MRNEVCEKINAFNTSDLVNRSIQEAAKYISSVTDRAKEVGYIKTFFAMDYENNYGDLILMGIRLENDKEYNARIKKENEKQERIDAKERAEYERLKAKYEPQCKDTFKAAYLIDFSAEGMTDEQIKAHLDRLNDIPDAS